MEEEQLKKVRPVAGTVVVEGASQADDKALKRFVASVFPRNAFQRTDAGAFFAMRGYARVTLPTLSDDPMVFTGNDKSVEKDFSTAFSQITCFWFVPMALFAEAQDILDEMAASWRRSEALNAKLSAQIVALNARVSTLEQRNTELEKKNAALEQRNAALEQRNAELERRVLLLEDENTSLRARVTELERLSYYQVRCRELQQENALLRAENEQLKNIDQ